MIPVKRTGNGTAAMAKMIKSSSVAEWMGRLPPDQRASLDRLRAQIRAAAPDAEETISYGMPTFTLNGHLVAFGAFKNHVSFFPMSSSLIGDYAKELEGFETSKGTIQFTPDKPIPAALIKRMVQERVAQNLKIAKARASTKSAKKAPAKAPAKKSVSKKTKPKR
jgi:uncharacterized protein YdhG (YjbR/CyaY superfamily)